MIVFIIFCLLIATDIKQLLKNQLFRKTINKRKFMELCFVFMGSIFSIYLISNAFNLNRKYMLILGCIVILCVLLIMNYNLQYLQKKQEFEELSQFMLRLCIYFRAHQKIYPAFLEAKEETSKSFKNKVDKVIEQIDKGTPFSVCSGEISKHYLMKSLAEIFESSEMVGHQHSESQLIRLEYDIENWMFQTKSYQIEEGKNRKRMVMLFGISLVIAYFAQNMLKQSFDMQGLLSYQKLMFSFISGNIICLLILSKRLTVSWMLEKEFI